MKNRYQKMRGVFDSVAQTQKAYSFLPSPSPFCAVFFLFFLVFLDPVDLDSGVSRIFKISSSSIFLSVLNLDKSGGLAAAILVMPFLVIATESCQ